MLGTRIYHDSNEIQTTQMHAQIIRYDGFIILLY